MHLIKKINAISLIAGAGLVPDEDVQAYRPGDC